MKALHSYWCYTMRTYSFAHISLGGVDILIQVLTMPHPAPQGFIPETALRHLQPIHSDGKKNAEELKTHVLRVLPTSQAIYRETMRTVCFPVERLFVRINGNGGLRFYGLLHSRINPSSSTKIFLSS